MWADKASLLHPFQAVNNSHAESKSSRGHLLGPHLDDARPELVSHGIGGTITPPVIMARPSFSHVSG